MTLFSSPINSSLPVSALAQIMALIPKDGLKATDQAQQQPGGQAPSTQSGNSNGSQSGISIPGIINSASNLTSLPWLSGAGNAASMAGSLAQGATGSSGIASALSSLMGLFA